jgi:chromosome segregation ATPase
MTDKSIIERASASGAVVEKFNAGGESEYYRVLFESEQIESFISSETAAANRKVEGLEAAARFWQDKCGNTQDELKAEQEVYAETNKALNHVTAELQASDSERQEQQYLAITRGDALTATKEKLQAAESKIAQNDAEQSSYWDAESSAKRMDELESELSTLRAERDEQYMIGVETGRNEYRDKLLAAENERDALQDCVSTMKKLALKRTAVMDALQARIDAAEKQEPVKRLAD